MTKLRTLGFRSGVADTRTVKPAPKVADRFYTSPEWAELRRTVIRMRGPVCEDCGRTEVRLFADHVVELKDGGAALDPTNIRLRCGSCHTLKTNAVRAARQRD